jgi:hypothetical protein
MTSDPACGSAALHDRRPWLDRLLDCLDVHVTSFVARRAAPNGIATVMQSQNVCACRGHSVSLPIAAHVRASAGCPPPARSALVVVPVARAKPVALRVRVRSWQAVVVAQDRPIAGRGRCATPPPPMPALTPREGSARAARRPGATSSRPGRRRGAPTAACRRPAARSRAPRARRAPRRRRGRAGRRAPPRGSRQSPAGPSRRRTAAASRRRREGRSRRAGPR